MNKIYKYCAAAFAGLLALTLGSCTNEYEYDAATMEGQQVYFNSALSSRVELSSSATSFQVAVNRIKTDEAISVPLTLTDASGLFSMPSSVDFAAGSKEALINISYDPNNFTYDDFKELTITIGNTDYTTVYGNSSYSFSAGVPSPWTSLGIGTYMDTFFSEQTFEVEIQQNDLDKNMFRVVNPYGDIVAMYGKAGYPVTGEETDLVFTVMQPGSTLAGVEVTMNDLIYFETTNTGIDAGKYGQAISLYHPASFTSLRAQTYWTYSYVQGYQDNGLPGAVQLAPYYYMSTVGGWNYTTYNDMVQIIFPNYVLADYTATVTYTGAFIDTSDNTYAMGNIKLGSDVETATVAVVEGSNAEEALNAVLSGTVETTTITESGEVQINCPYSGTCTMIVVTYDAEGNVQDYSYTTFNFIAGASDWKTLGTGLYTDHLLVKFLTDDNGNAPDPVEYEVEIQESKTTAGLYRILHPYAPGTYYYEGEFGYNDAGTYNLIVNASDPDHVFIEPQAIGFPDNDDEMLMLTIGGYYVAAGNAISDVVEAGYCNGKLKDGVITFPAKELCYSWTSYLVEGKFGYVNSTEITFLKLPSAVSAKATNVNAVKKQLKLTKNINKRPSFEVSRFLFPKFIESPIATCLK